MGMIVFLVPYLPRGTFKCFFFYQIQILLFVTLFIVSFKLLVLMYCRQRKVAGPVEAAQAHTD